MARAVLCRHCCMPEQRRGIECWVEVRTPWLSAPGPPSSLGPLLLLFRAAASTGSVSAHNDTSLQVVHSKRLSAAYIFILFLKRPWVSPKVLLLLLMLSYKLHVNRAFTFTHTCCPQHKFEITQGFIKPSHCHCLHYFLHMYFPAVLSS